MNLKKLYQYSQTELEDILDEAENKYYNNCVDLYLTDSEFDYIKEYLICHYPGTKYENKIGTEKKSGNKVDLPIWMGSMTNFKTEKLIINFTKKYEKDYVIMSKLDGISGLLYKKGNIIKLYTRGNGKKGKDISHLLEYINIGNLSSYNDIIIRGELLVEIKDYNIVANKWANERSLITGLVNSKKDNINKDLIKYLRFVSYELIHPQFEIKEQLNILKKIGLNIVDYIRLEQINLNILEKYLITFKEKSKYLIDGIIIRHNHNYAFNKSGNPDYAFAFKMILQNQIKETKIKKIHWNISKFGKLFPQIEVEQINIGGENIRFISGKSAKFIYNNKLGKDSIVEVIRSCDVIPDIYNIKKHSVEAEMPICKYKWNINKSDIYSIDNNNNNDKNIKLITDFFKSINTANLGPGLIKKLYKYNYNTIKKIINIKKEELLNIDGIKETLAHKLINNISEALYKCNIIDIMNASNIFQSGFGIKRLQNIYYNIKDVLIRDDKEQLLNEIKNIKGFNKITGEQFILNLDKFKLFLKDLNLEHKIEINIKNKILNKKNIVVSGFRDKENKLKHLLLKYNIEINERINNDTIYILCEEHSKNSNKIIEAKRKNIKIIKKNEFIKFLQNKFDLEN
jgi:DNA ligase (NAD+)